MLATIHPSMKFNTAKAVVCASLVPNDLGYANSLALLSRFSQLMQQEGQAVDTRRMQTDSAYAFEQLALAHTSKHDGQRYCAMQVFALFHE